MKDLFQPDNPVIRFLTRVCDCILLSILLSLLCLTVIGSGAAVTALYSMTLKMIRREDKGIIKGFFKALRNNFVPSVPATILMFVDITLLAVLCYALYAETLVFSPFIFVLLAIAAVFLTSLLSYLFPLLARFENTFSRHLENAVRLALANLPVTFLLTLVNLLPFLVIAFFPNVMAYFIGIWPLLGVAAGAYLNSFYLSRIFGK